MTLIININFIKLWKATDSDQKTRCRSRHMKMTERWRPRARPLVFHTVREAIEATYVSITDDENKADIRDYVFEVSNITTGTSARYRVNAHGNVKLIV